MNRYYLYSINSGCDLSVTHSSPVYNMEITDRPYTADPNQSWRAANTNPSSQSKPPLLSILNPNVIFSEKPLWVLPKSPCFYPQTSQA